LIGTGHFFAGAVVFITAEVLKLTVVERLFHLSKKKLLSIPAFAWGYGYWRQMMDAVQSLEALRVACYARSQPGSWDSQSFVARVRAGAKMAIFPSARIFGTP